MLGRSAISIVFLSVGLVAVFCTCLMGEALNPEGREPLPAGGFRAENIERPLRYQPQGREFVITNGKAWFNRPLYGGSSAFRVDAGDVPEFSVYLPGRGGNLRLGLRGNGGAKWLHEAAEVVARYRPGSMIYTVRDPLLGDGSLQLMALATRSREGLVVRAELEGAGEEVELLIAFGGVDGWRGRRGGDLGCESEPVAKLFQMTTERCRENVVAIRDERFVIRGKPGLVGGTMPAGTTLAVGDASAWDEAGAVGAERESVPELPVLTGVHRLASGTPAFLAIQRLAGGEDSGARLRGFQAGGDRHATGLWSPNELPELFAKEESAIRAIAGRLVVETPDPFVDAAVAALNVAEDAVWNDQLPAYLHGGVAWRVPLLGWRVSYAGDILGNHERTAQHFSRFAAEQNTKPVPAEIPAPEESANLARNETALHSNGNMTSNHYDMNLVAVDAFFRHLLWTGDLDFARRMWPVIERHLAWERRLFRREFGEDKLPLYEAYCCIWASDDLAYNGGGATHASAYNLYHNRMAARVARLVGEDASVYEREAGLIARGMEEQLWLADRGWFAEWRDLLGLQLAHPNAAAWTFYHTLDSEVPTPLEAWQMTRFVDTQLVRFPLRGPGIPEGCHTMPTTSWMPYTWSLNNVVFGEMMHSSLGYWQANRPEGAFPLFKGALIDSMYAGLCPGNVGMCTWFDANRRESQRDFSDGVGSMSRTVMQGLFGVKPDLLAGAVTLRPGFPKEWDHASMRHADFRFDFKREGQTETYRFEGGFERAVGLHLEAAALRSGIAKVEVNGEAAEWSLLEDSVGVPRIGIQSAAAREHLIVIEWQGDAPVEPVSVGEVEPQGALRADCRADIAEIADPQGALGQKRVNGTRLSGIAGGQVGHRTVFARVTQGDLKWWLPVSFEILSDSEAPEPVDWSQTVDGTLEPLGLGSVFNDSVTSIFRNDYRAPRSPFCSLATPKQGIGSWCHPALQFEVDDSGLRALAARGGGRIEMPNGVPFATNGDVEGKNVAFVSRWDNYPSEIAVPLAGNSSHVYLLMAGSTDAMKSRFDNGEVVVSYTDGTTTRLPLHNPTTWWPIDQDYFIDEFAFALPGPLPPRVDLATGRIRLLDRASFAGKGGVVRGGAATVLDLPLDASKELKSLTVRAIANEVVIGLMGVTLQR